MRENLVKFFNFVKRHDNIFVIMLIIFSILGITLNVYVTNSDELWNFQNVYKMYNGYQIYKDANVIVTPLFFWMGKFLFEILGANFFTFRIYNVFIMSTIYFLTYLLLKNIEISKKISIIIILTLIILKKYGMILVEANYNNLALMLCLLGIILNIKNYKKNHILQGILVFLIFITKQNIGIYYGIGLFLCEILKEKNLKNKIKILCKEFIVFFVCILLFLIYFYSNNNLYNFINYAFLGLGQFAGDNISVNIIDLLVLLFFIIINLSLSVTFLKNKKIFLEKTEKNNIVIFTCFSIPLTLIMYPILNDAHFLIGIYVSMLLFIYFIFLIIKKIDIKINQKIINIILFIFSAVTLYISNINYYSWKLIIENEEYQFNNNPYYGGIITDDVANNMDEIISYIKNDSSKIIVLSNKAAFYMIQIKGSNGMMDLPLRGNLGKNGENGLIDEIKKMKNTKILIEKEEKDINWQESKIVRKYIMENMENIGEIQEFLIYEEK